MLVEVLLQIIDKVNPDPAKDHASYKAFDVIIIRPSPWPWTPTELANPDWRIVKADLPVTLIESLQAGEVIPEGSGRSARRREYTIDGIGLLNNVKNNITKAANQGIVIDYSSVSSEVIASWIDKKAAV